jgi:hypothetical protein
MYHGENRFDVPNGTIVSWTMQGRPGRNAGLKITLQARFVVLPDGKRGLALVESGTTVPDGVVLTAYQPLDMANDNGRTVWLAGGNGLVAEFESDMYELLRVEEAHSESGVLYFHSWLPEGLGGDGQIVYSDDQFLEIAPKL